MPPPLLDEKKIKIHSLFFSSVLLTIAFPNWKIWFTHVLSSLCRRPQMIGSLYKILNAVRVVAYVRDHEASIQKKRMSATDPRSRLLDINTNLNILNLAVLDNIDMKNKTFQYGNIYDVVHTSAHATLRMVFQFERLELPNLEQFEIQNLFGISPMMKIWNKKIDTIFSQLINQEQTFDIKHINIALKENIESASFLAPPNVVILEAGEAPSKNENVHQAVDMYLEDFGYTENGILNLVCDEAIYRRMKDYKNEEQEVYCILGQWHTSKTMCNALIVAFSGYGLFGLVTQLGVKFLDKLEQNVDYRSTFRVLELIWIAVGVVIHQYAKENNISIEEIPAESNNLLKVWYNFYRWAGYLKLHKLGIRMANFDLQIHSLMAFAPLFPITKRIRYTESVARFLVDLQRKPQLLQDLRTVPSINMTQKGHYFAYDEALETFGVKFIKENMVGYKTTLEDLKRNIKSAQAENERINFLISEFTEDRSVGKNPRSVKDRQEALWKLINELKAGLSDSQPESHALFTKTTQLTTAGYRRMFHYYQSGIDKMNKVATQIIHSSTGKVKIERDELDLISMKAAKRSKLEKEAVQTVIVNVEEVSNSSIHALESYDMEIEETNQNLQVQFSGSKSRKPRISHKITPEEKKSCYSLRNIKNHHCCLNYLLIN